MSAANEIRDALAATLAHGMAGMTCMDTHDARAFLADRDQWKARAEKAEAALRAIASGADEDIKLGTTSGATFWRAGLVFARDAARAAVEANDAGR